MKTNQLTTAQTQYHNPDLENRITHEHQQIKKEAILSARFFAESDKPDVNENDLLPYIGSFLSKYDQLEMYAAKQIQAATHKAQGKVELDSWKELNEKLQKSIEELSHKAKLLKHRLAGMTLSYNWNLYEIIMLGIVVSSGMEAFLSKGAFQLFGENRGISYIIALFFGVIMGFLAHFISHYFKTSQTVGQLKRRIVWATIVMALVFYGLTTLRLLFFKKTGVEADALSPIYFVLINLVFFAVSVALAYLYMPTKEDRLAKTKQKELVAEIAQTEREVNELESQQEEAIKERDKALSARMAIIEYGEYIKKWIQSLRKETIEVFKSENIHHRKSAIPNCFKQIQ